MAQTDYWGEVRIPSPSNVTWNKWTAIGTTGSPMSITYHEDTWRTWTGTSTSTGASYWYTPQTQVWQQWQDQPHVLRYEPYTPRVIREPTQAELDAAQRRREEESARRLAAQRRLTGAQDRALGLLRSLLTEDQVLSMEAKSEVQVRGSDGGLYVIETNRVHGNIRATDEHGCTLGRLCVQPGMWDHAEGAALPLADGHVGQLLAIRFDERKLRETANWSGVRACQQPDVPILRAA